MKPIRLNKKFNITPDEIEKIKDKGNIFWVYRKERYPKIIKSFILLTTFSTHFNLSWFNSSEIIKFKKEKIQ